MPDIRGGLLLKQEQAIGDVDSINVDFSTSKRYIPNTLSVYLNGQILTRGIDFIETTNQIFAMTNPPINTLNYTDIVMVEYQQ